MANKTLKYGNKIISLGGNVIRPGSIIKEGLVLWVDPKDRGSFPNTGSTVYDKSDRALSGTTTNDTYLADTVWRMDGSNDVVNFDADQADFFLSGDCTLQFWIKPVHRPYSSRRAGIGRNDSYRQDINVTLESHPTYRISFYYGMPNTPNNYFFRAANQVFRYTTDEWNHVTVQRDMTTSSVKFYKNGVLITESFTPQTDNDGNEIFPYAVNTETAGGGALQQLRLGKTHVGFHEGDFGSAYLYDRVLTADEVYENYLAEKYRYPHIPTKDLVVHVDANNPQYNSNITAVESFPQGDNSRTVFYYSNDAHIEKSSEISALHYDGTNDWVRGSLPAADASGCLNNFTCLGWIRPDPSGINGQRVFGFSYISMWQLELRGGTQENRSVGVNWRDEDYPSIPYKFNTNGPRVKYDTWQQIGIVCRDSTITYIYNGEEQNSFSVSGDINYGTFTFSIGNHNSGSDGAYLGQIANCHLWTRPLDAKEIKFVYDTYKSKYGF